VKESKFSPLHWLIINQKVLIPIAFFAVCLIVFIPNAPNIKFLDRDGSLFLFFGRSILEGKVPYRDLWDHKGPVLYFINAFALFISSNSIWGIWAVEIVHLLTCTIVLFNILKINFSQKTAFLGSLFFLSAFSAFIQGGNFTEEFSLLPILLSAYLLCKSNHGITRTIALIIGALFGFVFFLRPNNIGFYLSLILVLTLSIFKRNHPISTLVYLFSGLVAITGLVFLYFDINQAIPDFIDQLFMRNFFYSVAYSTMPERIQGLFKSFLNYPVWLIIPVIGLILSIAQNQANNTLLKKVLIINLPLELLLLSVSGRFFPHYYLCILPALTYFFCDLIGKVVEYIEKLSPICLLSIFPILSIVLTIPLWLNLDAIRPFMREVVKYGNRIKSNELIEYVQASTSKMDTILVWGYDPMVYLYSNRFTSTRYSYQQAFETPNYTKPEMIVEFCEDLAKKPPMLIIDTRDPFPLSAQKRDRVTELRVLKYKCLLDLIDTHYSLQNQIDPNYDVFAYNN